MSIRTMNFDAVGAAAPLDRQASVVRDGSGDLWDATIPPHHQHWDAPPLAEAGRPASAADLTGRQMGRMIAVRYHRSHPKHGAQWLMRCVCGSYELRRAKAIQTNTDDDHCCWVCNRVNVLRKRGAAANSAARRQADESLLDRLANPQTCRDCRTPATCAAFENCALYQSVAA